MAIITYYHILGIKSNATVDEIAAAYRRKIKEWHPDVCRHADAEERMREVNEAAEVLLDPCRRKKYDASFARELSLFRNLKSWKIDDQPIHTPADEPAHDRPSPEPRKKRGAAAHKSPFASQRIRYAAGFCAAGSVFLMLVFVGLSAMTSPAGVQSGTQFSPNPALTNLNASTGNAQMAIEQGDELFDTGDYEGALRVYDAVIARNPDLPSKEVWYNRGIALNFLGHYRDASESFDQVLSISPDNPQALAQKGASLLSLGRYEDALGYTDRALAGSSNAAWIWNNRTIAVANLGQKKEPWATNARVLTPGRSGY
jgi:curved DNA-binding protein CbpA